MSIPCSRTFAIIKPNFLHHRLNIESLLSEAGFEIIKERQIHFHPSDESLVHIFGEEAHTLVEGAVWVYVLEKENAVSDLLVLIAGDGPDAAQVNAQSIRAKFGRFLENGIYGAPDCDAAEMQIATIFASSPPFPPTEMSPNDGDVPVLTELSLTDSQRAVSEETQGSGAQRITNARFRARPVPPTTAQPSIQPRTTRAAALRAGIIPTPSPPKVRGPPTKEVLARTFANVPGHKRATSIAVASTAAPAIAPRPTRASMLRTGGQAVLQSRPRASTTLISETPGYKRQLNIQVASIAPPAIQPRATRASSLRTGQAPSPKKIPRPSASSRPRNTFVGVPGHKRSESIPVASIKPPTTAPRLNRSATLRARGTSSGLPLPFKESANLEDQQSERALSTQRSHSSLSTQPSRPTLSRGRSGPPPTSYVPPTSVSPPRPPSVTRAPSIEPRTNRSALLRARMGTPTGSKNPSPKFIAV